MLLHMPKRKKKKTFKTRIGEKRLKIIKVVLAPNEMKLRIKLLVSNREQTKIKVSLSPPYPSPHPTHQQQMRNTAKAQSVVFCSRAGPDPRLHGRPPLSSGTQRQGCFWL